MSALPSSQFESETAGPQMRLTLDSERRRWKRKDIAWRDLEIDRMVPGTLKSESLGRIVDMSAGGIKVHVSQHIPIGTQIYVRLRLPAFAGISPFLAEGALRPASQWVGYVHVARITRDENGQFEAGLEMLDLDDRNRGMLGLYLSTMPAAA
ncbi:MAG: PilZ domain-containing protein [Phycisphaerae bacterium]